MIIANGVRLPKHMLFPGGEVGVNVKAYFEADGSLDIDLHALIRNSDDLMALFLTVNALREQAEHDPRQTISLKLLYLPYARQDRVCNLGEANSLKVIGQLLNSLKLNRVSVLDPHSDVALGVVNNCSMLPQWEVAAEMLGHLVRKEHYELVCPDAGAEKKTNRLAKELGAWGLTPPVHYARKKRNLATGEITATEIDGDFTGKDLVIVDDICDGGRTFVELAKVLKKKGAGKLALYVTHGIFSKGIDELKEHFDHVYAAYSFKEPSSDFLTLSIDMNKGEAL
jgi:ribose-phosphate pyrophosphokinase